MRTVLLSLFLLLSLLASLAGVYAKSGPKEIVATPTAPTGFLNESFISTGLVLPTAIAFAPGNTVFIAEKRGVVRVWRQGALLAAPFIDIQDDVNSLGDRGMLGLAVHPDFPNTPYVYLLYTYDPPGAPKDGVGARVSRLLRVTAQADNPYVAATSEGSRVVILGTNSTLANSGNVGNLEDSDHPACGRGPVFDEPFVRDCVPSDADTHSIGTVTFGPDGNLYVGTGDGAGYTTADPRALRAQELDSMGGKIFRLDPITGRGLRDNPFWDGDADSNRSKVLSYGLRNPFRFTLHPRTGELYTGDVGWATWEEINVGNGKNFGWPCYEGGDQGSARQGQYANNGGTLQRCQQLYAEGEGAVQAPAYAYQHFLISASVAAGGFYAGTAWPVQYRNALFISDYSRNWIKFATFDADGRVTVHDFAESVADRGGPAQVTFGPDGNLYYVALGMLSEIRRIRYVPNGNSAPTADIVADKTSGSAPLTVKFSGRGSADAEGQTLSYAWDFGDGGKSTQAEPEHVYTREGRFTATLIVTDPQGLAGSAQLEIIVGNSRPDFYFTSPGPQWTYYSGGEVGFSVTATDPEEGDVSYLTQYKVLLHHGEHVHFDQSSYKGSSGTFIAEDHGDNTYYEVCAVAYDTQGAASVGKCLDVRPFTVRYTIDTVPSGLRIDYGGASYTTPFTVPTITNSKRDLSAPTTQNGYQFSDWSDGGARAHTLTIEDGPRTLIARYQPVGPVTADTPVYLSDLTPTYQANGWGPMERDLSNGEAAARDGRVLTINGVQYPKGLGVHALSEVRYALDGQYSRFQTDVGVDDEVGLHGSVVFQVFADGEKLYDSGLMFGYQSAKHVSLSIAGKRELRLLVLTGNGNRDQDHADWAGARLIRAVSAAVPIADATQAAVQTGGKVAGFKQPSFFTGRARTWRR
ncbi:MAG: NPCBM/NEW2 domain-containing protein [Acidobacteria bacterium]|nr:NPCBM/NEW2 domain-containing protein [Acidobacteriota bacterium]MBI3427989.1 NPCBM/NEW2 domain-containing protein [Acidobacteriota bacterium]